MNGVEYETAAGSKYPYSLGYLVYHLLPGAEGKCLLGIYPAPQKTSLLPNCALSHAGSMPAAEVCTGLRISRWVSMSIGIIRVTDPQVCCQVFHDVCS